MPTYGSLFTGIGGIDLGLDRAGFACQWQVENNEFCRAVLAKHWPRVPRFGDVKELTGDELESVDLVAGGFPCQPVSKAGRRRGTADERWLWPEFARIVRLLRPRVVLVENVPGILGRGLGDVLGDLAESGYDAEWDCIPAAAVGAPHLRDRTFIVAYPAALSDADGRGHLHRETRIFAAETWVYAQRQLAGCTGWEAEPDIQRVADGSAVGVDDRLRAIGNAVVPQVAEWIGRRILECLDV